MKDGKTILMAALLGAGMIAGAVSANETAINIEMCPKGNRAFCMQLRAVSPLHDAVKVWSFADGAELKASGSVRPGVALGGLAKTASLARGGDGMVAQFEGGYFMTGGDANVDKKQMTLLVRARSEKGWSGALLARNDPDELYANLLYGGSFTNYQLSQLDYRERQRIKQGKIIEYCWKTDPLPERVIPEAMDKNGSYRKLAKRAIPGTDLYDGVTRVKAPVELIGAEGWHDIVVRYSGVKLQIFVDGVPVDTDFPHGTMRNFAPPFLIGAGMEGGKVASPFYGQMDTIAIWDRALTDEEIIALSGGANVVLRRKQEIEGPQPDNAQYWRPPNFRAVIGDVMLSFHHGVLHFFYLEDARGGQKPGMMQTPWGHLTTRDLKNWEVHPYALEPDEQTEGCFGTGQMFVENGVYHLFWINHGRRLPYADAPKHRYFDNIYLATSRDGIHFEKRREPWVELNIIDGHDSNPMIWKETGGDRYFLFNANLPSKGKGKAFLLQTDDLKTWKPVVLPHMENMGGICLAVRKWNDWHYVIGSGGYRKSRTPIEQADENFRQFHPFGEAWVVPQAANFTGNRMIMAGSDRPGNPPYATSALFRELVQHEDGSLGLKFVPEMIPESGEPLGSVKERVTLSANGEPTREFVAGLPRNVRMTMTVVPQAGAGGFGLTVRAMKDYSKGKELRFEPGEKRFRYTEAPNGAPARIMALNKAWQPSWDQRTPYQVNGVNGLDRPFQLDVIVKDNILDVCIDNRRTLYHRGLDGYDGDNLVFFTEAREVEFKDIAICLLK
jgi:hypothetical protein